MKKLFAIVSLVSILLMSFGKIATADLFVIVFSKLGIISALTIFTIIGAMPKKPLFSAVYNYSSRTILRSAANRNAVAFFGDRMFKNNASQIVMEIAEGLSNKKITVRSINFS